MPETPDLSNFFSSLHTSLSRHAVAELYRPLGWTIRKCTWVDYEIECDFADLIIESEDPILMHGAVADVTANAERIVEPLRRAGIAYSFECYGRDDELLQEVKWSGPSNP